VSKWTTCFGHQVAIVRSNTRRCGLVQSYAREWDVLIHISFCIFLYRNTLHVPCGQLALFPLLITSGVPSVRRLQSNNDMASVAPWFSVKEGCLGFCLFFAGSLLDAGVGFLLPRSGDLYRGVGPFHSKPCLRLKRGGASRYCVVGVVVRKSVWS
jgi:hypothetical protein